MQQGILSALHSTLLLLHTTFVPQHSRPFRILKAFTFALSQLLFTLNLPFQFMWIECG